MSKSGDNLPCIIAIDAGTTAIKFVVFEMTLKELFLLESPLRTYRDEKEASEQDAQEVWETVKLGLQSIAKKYKNPQALCFSAAMHSLLAVNQEGVPISKAMLWSDLRSKEEAAALRNSEIGIEIYKETGTPIHPMSPLSKLIWWKKYKPESFAKAFKFISLKEYIICQLTAKYVIDYGMASATGLFAPALIDWHKKALNLSGITPAQLSTITSPTSQIPLSPTIAETLGLPQALNLVPGSSDGCLANLGDNATQAGIYAISIGTSGAVRTVSDKFETDKSMRLFSYMLDQDIFVHGGAVNNGAIAIEWLGKQILGDVDRSVSPAEITEMAESAPIAADGLLFLPYIQGERAPFWNPDLKGGVVGMTIQHSQKHLARAVMEGVLYNLNYVMQSVASIHPPPRLIKASGGFTKSPFWLQMLADISNCPVEVNDGMLSAARGAAMLALQALNQFQSEIKDQHHLQTFTPIPENHKIYQQNFNLFVKEIEKLR